MSWKYAILTVLGLFHLGLVALGAFEVEIHKPAWLSSAVVLYGQASGAGDAYGFFAPSVWGQERALFDVTGRDGQLRTITLETHASREADLRVGNIISQFQNQVPKSDSENYQRAVAASLAGAVFGRIPSARRVTVRLEQYVPPSMSEYRRGARSDWTSLYRASFEYAGATTGRTVSR